MMLPSGNKRKNALFAISALLLAWIIIGGMLMPMQEESEWTDRKIRTARNDLRKMKEMADRYITLSASLPQGMRTEPSGVSTLSDVENISRRLGIENRIKRMSPEIDPVTKRENGVSLTITDIPYAPFIDFLQALYESGSVINVRRAKISASFENRSNINVEMTVSKSF